MKSRLNLNIMGNIFYLDKHINFKTITTSIVLTSLTFFLPYFSEGKGFVTFDIVKSFLYLFLGLTIIYLAVNFKLIGSFFKTYYKFNFITIGLSLMELFISISLVIVYSQSLIGYILALSWLLSGCLRITIESTPALFYSDIKELLKLIQVFAFTRIAYFSILALLIFTNFSTLPLYFWLILLILNMLLISNLNPYAIKHGSVRGAILILRKIGEEKIVKTSKLDSIYLSKSYLDRLLKRWDDFNLIELRNNRVELSNRLKIVKENYKNE
jgi:hypothetical protein